MCIYIFIYMYVCVIRWCVRAAPCIAPTYVDAFSSMPCLHSVNTLNTFSLGHVTAELGGLCVCVSPREREG